LRVLRLCLFACVCSLFNCMHWPYYLVLLSILLMFSSMCAAAVCHLCGDV
jgi:hypothetical protein